MTDPNAFATLRRRLIGSLGASALAIAVPCRAQSGPVAGWPARPVRVMVPGPAGSQTDLFARFICEHFAKVFGQPFVVDNKPGGSGIIASMAAAKAAPDGYTLLLSNASFVVVARALGVPMAYELNELAPIAQLAVGGTILSVAPELPARTVKELLDHLAKQPRPLSYGTLGNGSSSHLTMEWLMSSNGLKATHVPYKSGSEVGRDLAAGVIPMGWVDTSTALPLMQAGRIRGLAVNATQRMPASPDMPTLTEAGYRFETNGWQAVFATGGTPDQHVHVTAGVGGSASRTAVHVAAHSLGR
jgi:tripartite-type tricarboxylate transporter receptor subunit TctC